MREKRKKIWIDRIQTQLSVRIAAYFLLYQFAIWSLFWLDARMNALDGVVGPLVPTLGFILVVVGPISLSLLFIYDAMKETHRIVGPLYRFHKTIQDVTNGSVVSLIKLRDKDQLQQLANDLNLMLRELEQRGAITLSTPEPAKEQQLIPV